jgi:hypothetical protein
MSIAQAKVVAAVAFGCTATGEVEKFCGVSHGTVMRCYGRLKEHGVLALETYFTKCGRWSVWCIVNRKELKRLFPKAVAVMVARLGTPEATQELHRIQARQVPEAE